MDIYSFQNCQKIVVFNRNNDSVFLAKRKGEKDYDGTFSFIGGKMEHQDKDIIKGLRREKNEEVGENFKIKLYPVFNTMNLFTKKDGNRMILPHYYAQYIEGEVLLNEEYSEYRWVSINDLPTFQPLIPTVPVVTNLLLKLTPIMTETEFVIL